jgi:hypothetical protein
MPIIETKQISSWAGGNRRVEHVMSLPRFLTELASLCDLTVRPEVSAEILYV